MECDCIVNLGGGCFKNGVLGYIDTWLYLHGEVLWTHAIQLFICSVDQMMIKLAPPC